MASVNGFETIPWLVSNADISADVGRLVSAAAVGGAEGILSAGDLKVTATAGTVDSYVHIGRGGGSVKIRAANAYNQNYVVRAPNVSDVQPASTGSSSRSDLICVQVLDPEFDSVTQPTVVPLVIPGVPASTQRAWQLGAPWNNKSILTLARIDIPSGKTTFQDSYITDLRQLAVPHNANDLSSQNMLNNDSLTTQSPAWQRWPNISRTVYVPEWCTWMSVKVDFAGVLRTNGSVGGELRTHLGTFHTSGLLTVEWDALTAVDMATATSRESFFLTASAMVPAQYRGTFVEVWTEGHLVFPQSFGGHLEGSSNSQMAYDIRFEERAV